MYPGLAPLSLIISMLALCIWNYTHWTRRKIKQRFQFSPLGDNFKHFFGISSFQDVLQSIYNSFPNTRYVGFYQFLQPGLLIRDPELIKAICMKEKDVFIDRTPFMSESSDELWNKNLFALRGDEWKEMRRTLSPAFTSGRMRGMFIHIFKYARTFVNTLRSREGESFEVELKELFCRFTNDIIGSVAFGYEVNSLEDPNNKFFLMGKAATNSSNFWKNFKIMLTLLWPPLGQVVKSNFFDEEISAYFRQLVKDTISHRNTKKISRNDMLQLLMRAHELEESTNSDNKGPRKKLAGDDIVSQALIFFLGGYETVSSVMCFMAYELALNPDIQERLHQEVTEFHRIMKKPMYTDLTHLPYLNMTLSETLRKWPPILNLDRICDKDYTIPSQNGSEADVHLQKGSLLWLPVWCIHHDPKHWPNPEKFDPERFSDWNSSKQTKGTYIPFGLGNRSCIGSRFASIQIKAFFYELLRKFRIVPSPSSQIPFVQVKHAFTLASQDGFHFTLEKRIINAEDEDDYEDHEDEDDDDEQDLSINDEDEKKNDDKKNDYKSDDKEEGDNENSAIEESGNKMGDEEEGDNEKSVIEESGDNEKSVIEESGDNEKNVIEESGDKKGEHEKKVDDKKKGNNKKNKNKKKRSSQSKR